MSLTRLSSLTGAVFVNREGVSFKLDVDRERVNRKTRYVAYLSCKRFRDSPNCRQFDIDDDPCEDPFCKCNWSQRFHCQGTANESIDHLIVRTLAASSSLCWCQSCSALTPTTTERLCFSCVVSSLLSTTPEECCICTESTRSSCRLECSHTLCYLCIRKLLESELQLACPACRRPLSKEIITAAIPETTFYRCDFPLPAT